MASRRPGPGELLAGASGFLLLLATLLPWFGIDSSAQLPGTGQVIDVYGNDLNAWEAFAGIDLVLAVAAALAIAALAVGFLSQPPVALWLAVGGAAAVAALLIVYRLIDPPSIAIDEAPDTAYETGRRLGAFFGLLCTGAMAWGANLAGAEAPAEAEEAPAEPEPRPASASEPVLAPPARPEPARPAPAPPAPAPPAPARSAARPARAPAPRPAAPRAPAARPAPATPAPALATGPLGGWTRAAVDAEVATAWRRHDRRLGARYERYFADHPELAGDGRGTARDLAAALPPGGEDLAGAVPADAWGRGHLSGKSSRTLGVGLLGLAAKRDPSLAWLWDSLGPLPPPGEDEPRLEFVHVVAPELLGERPRQTSFDALVDDSNVLIGIETKWREHGIGGCLCRGDGVGPNEGQRCSRRVETRAPYWESADDVLGLGGRTPGAPCPISPVYELVRHAAALRALAGPERLAVLALLYDGANPYFAPSGDWPGWPALIREAVSDKADPDDFRFVARSWQELAPELPLDEPVRAWAADKHGLD
jgi:hypothetical protein